MSGPGGFFRVESNEAAGCLCVVVVVVVVCGCGCCCGCGVCAVWCGVVCEVTHAGKPSCARSKRSVSTDNTSTCVNTCGCGAGTHRDVLNVHTGTF